jgi:hypothetical protein
VANHLVSQSIVCNGLLYWNGVSAFSLTPTDYNSKEFTQIFHANRKCFLNLHSGTRKRRLRIRILLIHEENTIELFCRWNRSHIYVWERKVFSEFQCLRGVMQPPPGGNYGSLSVRFSRQLWTAACAETETAQGVSRFSSSDLFGLLSVCRLLLLLQQLAALRIVIIFLVPLRFNTFTTTLEYTTNCFRACHSLDTEHLCGVIILD